MGWFGAGKLAAPLPGRALVARFRSAVGSSRTACTHRLLVATHNTANACRLSKGCQQRTDFGGGVRVPSAAYSVASPLFYIYRQRLYNSTRNTWVPKIFKRNNLDTPRMTLLSVSISANEQRARRKHWSMLIQKLSSSTILACLKMYSHSK